MSLGLSVYHTGGEFSPRLQYNAASGRFTRVDKTPDGAGIIRAEFAMTAPPVFALDLGSLEIGWLQFGAGLVSIVVVPFGQQMPERPTREHKAGFRAKVWEGPGRRAVEFSANAGVTVNAVEALWNLLTAAPEAAAGQIPVVRVVNTVAVGKNYAPVFDLVQWMPRDEAIFGRRTVAAPGSPPIAFLASVPTTAPNAVALVQPAAAAPSAWQVPASVPAATAWPVAA